MTASDVSSRSEGAAIVGVLAARWPAPVRYVLAAISLLVGIGTLAAIDLVLLPRYLGRANREPPPPLTEVRPAPLPLAPREGMVAQPEAPPKQQPAAPSASRPALPRVPEIPEFPHLLFAMKDVRLSPAAGSILRQVAAVLKREPQLHVVLSGHTDDLGTPAFNDILSLRRAQGCGKALEKYGVEPERIETHGFGATRPLDGARSFPARARNRRVEIDLR
jgi:outer membrane protein OmpA-like peptidoglycan-associated protein